LAQAVDAGGASPTASPRASPSTASPTEFVYCEKAAADIRELVAALGIDTTKLPEIIQELFHLKISVTVSLKCKHHHNGSDSDSDSDHHHHHHHHHEHEEHGHGFDSDSDSDSGVLCVGGGGGGCFAQGGASEGAAVGCADHGEGHNQCNQWPQVAILDSQCQCHAHTKNGSLAILRAVPEVRKVGECVAEKLNSLAEPLPDVAALTELVKECIDTVAAAEGITPEELVKRVKHELKYKVHICFLILVRPCERERGEWTWWKRPCLQTTPDATSWCQIQWSAIPCYATLCYGDLVPRGEREVGC
jgi:hypothetical protein